QTWTDREVRHGPASCFCYLPCINTVTVQPVTELRVHQCALVEDRRDPSKSRYIYGPCLFRLEHAYQEVGKVEGCHVLDQVRSHAAEERRAHRRTAHLLLVSLRLALVSRCSLLMDVRTTTWYAPHHATIV